MKSNNKRAIAGLLFCTILLQCTIASKVDAFADMRGPFLPVESGKPARQITFLKEMGVDETQRIENTQAEEEKMQQSAAKWQEDGEQLQETLLEDEEYIDRQEIASTDSEIVLRQLDRQQEGVSSSVQQEGNSIYANGIPILIKMNGDRTYVYDASGENFLLDAPISDQVSIFGGAKDSGSSVPSTQITFESGTVANIIGGGRASNVTGDTSIDIKGGTVTGLVCGGGKDEGTSVENTNITVSGNSKIKWVYGGGYNGDISGSTKILLEGGSVSYLCGGGFSGSVAQGTSIHAINTKVEDTVFGGGWSGTVNGGTSIVFDGGSSTPYLCGGGFLQAANSDNTKIKIDGGVVSEKVYGGGWDGNVSGSAEISVVSGLLETVYGGGFKGTVKEATNVSFRGGKCTSLYGAGQAESATVENTTITLSSGTINWLYGGGWKGQVSQKSKLTFSGGTVENTAFGGGHLETAKVAETEIIVSDKSKIGFLYGGGEFGSVSSNSSVAIQGGAVTTLYGGGKDIKASMQNSSVSLEAGTVDFLYGGGNSGHILGTAKINMKGGTVETVYGGGANGTVLNTEITLSGAEVGWIYGGGRDGAVTEQAKITIDAGTIAGNVYGGGRGLNSTVKTAMIAVNGGTAQGVFGGGDQGSILEKTELTLASQNKINFASGGGYSGATKESLVTVKDGEIQSLYGGGYAAKTEAATIKIEQGKIGQLIAGSGDGGTTGNAKLETNGGYIVELYPGYCTAVLHQYTGASILVNHIGTVVDKNNIPLYKATITVGNPACENQDMQCQIGEETAWNSKTNGKGELILYLPETEKTILATDTEDTVYSGKITANKNNAASTVLLSEGQKCLVHFAVKEGKGSILAETDGQTISANTHVPKGANITFTATPEDGYTFRSWWSSEAGEIGTENPYIYENISQVVKIEAIFIPIPANKDKLTAEIQNAENARVDIFTSVDGKDIQRDRYWVTRSVMDLFLGEIQAAKDIHKQTDVTQNEVDTSLDNLMKAIIRFNQEKKLGTWENTEVDKVELNELITKVKAEAFDISISADGNDVFVEYKWVTQESMDAVLNAIAEAESIADKSSVTQSEIDLALTNLKEEEARFLSAQKNGNKQRSVLFYLNMVGKGTVYASVNGNLIESPYQAPVGSAVQFEAIPDAGYEVDKWTRNGQVTNQGMDTYDLSDLQEFDSICVYFKKIEKSYSVSVSDSITGGIIRISPNGTVLPGTIVVLSILPEEGYSLREGSLQYNGNVILNNQFVMPAEDVLIMADFIPVDAAKKYTLEVIESEGGTVFGSGEYKEGESVKIEAYPNAGYRFISWESQDEDYILSLISPSTSVIMPNKPMLVKAYFAKRSDPDDGNNGGGGGGISGIPNEIEKELPPKEVSVLLENHPESVTAFLQTTARTDGKGTALIEIPELDTLKALESANKEVKQGQSVIINFTSVLPIQDGVETEKLHILFPKKFLLEFEKLEGAQFTLNTDMITMKLDQALIQSILSMGQDDIQVSITKGTSFSKQAQEMLGNRPAYEFNLISNQQQLTTFNGNEITVGIPYQTQKDEVAENIKGCYIDNSGVASIWEDSLYDQAKNILWITTSHFSSFGVTYVEESAAEDETQSSKLFQDVQGHWAKDDIQYLLDKGIVNGMSDTAFMPDEKMTRSMLVTILGRFQNVDITQFTSTKFEDIEETAYYAPYVAWALEEKIVAGVDTNHFQPDEAINREQLATIVYQYAKASGISLPSKQEKALFQDYLEVSSWAEEAISMLQQAEILQGKENMYFYPKEQATRAEVSAVLKRVFMLQKEE